MLYIIIHTGALTNNRNGLQQVLDYPLKVNQLFKYRSGVFFSLLQLACIIMCLSNYIEQHLELRIHY